ncbi:MAG TPA: hypothetical protein VI636_06210 [Candidatus Angelobacter sp.]
MKPSIAVTNPAVNLATVLQDESLELQELCGKRHALVDLHPDASAAAPGPPDRLGVAFSGGGIRSAAVNLGLIQALAKCDLLEPCTRKHEASKESQGAPEKGVKGDLLRFVHYLSGISGGGYILGWLTAWISRNGFDTVQEQLAAKCPPPLPTPSPLPASSYRRFLEPQPLRNLRQYASFLTPRTGLFSGDTLALVSIYLRNLLLNQTLMVAAAAGLIALQQMLAPSILWAKKLPGCFFIDLVQVAFATAILAGGFIGWCLRCLARNENPKEPRGASLCVRIFALFAAAAIWLLLPTAVVQFRIWLLLAASAVLVVLSSLIGLIVARLFKSKTDLEPVRKQLFGIPIVGAAGVASSFFAGGFFGLLIYAFTRWLTDSDGTSVRVGGDYAALGLPAILLAFALASYVYIGIYGDSFPDAKREWLGRLAGYFLYFALVAAVVMIIAIWGPLFMRLIFGGVGATATKWLKWIVPGGWLFTVISGLFVAKSPSTGDPETKSSLDILVKVAPPLFLIGVLLLVSWGVHGIVRWNQAGPPASKSTQQNGGFLSTEPVQYHRIDEYLDTGEWKTVPPDLKTGSPSSYYVDFAPCSRYSSVNDINGPWAIRVSCGSKKQESSPHGNYDALKALGKILLVCTVIAGLLLWRLDVNEFSMHLLYRNRLVRAFLGASNPTRNPSPFTGFGLDDDVPLQDLCQKSLRIATNHALDWSGEYDGPYPLWGTALNLTSGEIDLAWQKRKAASFIYSPLYCGWDYVSAKPGHVEPPQSDSVCADSNRCKYGYRGTGKYTPDGVPRDPAYTGHGVGPSVGTALAASGAAVSPNWGYHSSPAVAALLALFNIRIGWWTGNPRHNRGWCKYAPRPQYLLYEVAGSIGDDDQFVYLSDGGHFENLGVYELVRRRMKFIIACDADADPDYGFEDLGNAIEKCRRDFGVKIDMRGVFDVRPGKAATAESDNKKPDDGNSAARWEFALRKPDFSRSHSAVGLITYPQRDLSGKPTQGVLLYIKSSLTGDEEADVLSQHLSNPAFPHDTTLNQFFNETQFEAYRALGQHMFESIWEKFRNSPECTDLPASREAKIKKRIHEFFADHLARPLFSELADGI